jgi:hypothetical protein
MKHSSNSYFMKLGIRGINLPLALRIRSRQAGIMIFVVSILIMLALKSIYPMQSCQNVQASMQIIDESGLRQLSASYSFTADTPLKSYINSVSKHILAKIKEMPECHGTSESHPEIQLFFVLRPLSKPAQETVRKPFQLERTSSRGTRYLDSPWVKLRITHSPKLIVQAVFLWNERQFLLDQALMSGARASPVEPLVPIDERVFRQFTKDYMNSVLLGKSFEAESAAKARLAERFPVEVFWLLSHAWQSTLAPFDMEVDHALRSTVESAAIGYTNLSNTLVDQFLSSDKTEVRYKSVLDLKDVLALDQYRINRLH